MMNITLIFLIFLLTGGNLMAEEYHFYSNGYEYTIKKDIVSCSGGGGGGERIYVLDSSTNKKQAKETEEVMSELRNGGTGNILYGENSRLNPQPPQSAEERRNEK